MKILIFSTFLILFFSCNQNKELKPNISKSPINTVRLKHEKLIGFSYVKTDAINKLNPVKPTEFKTAQIGEILLVSFETSGGNCDFTGDIRIKNDSLFLLYNVDSLKVMLKEEMNYKFKYEIENKELKVFKIKVD